DLLTVCGYRLINRGPRNSYRETTDEGPPFQAGGFFLGLTSRRAAGDQRPQARRAVRAPRPACQGCARYYVVGAPDILRGCAARRSWPEGLIAGLSLMITSAPNEKCCRRLQRTAPARSGRAARLQKPPAKKKVP